MDDFEWGWVVGVLEGEGCFSAKSGADPRLRIQVGTADEDVAIRLQELTGVGRVNGPYWQKESEGKPHAGLYRWNVNRRDDVEWLLTALLPLMSKRRQEQIQAAFQAVK